jgi:uncharacterized protein with HEPN domain
MFEEEKYSLETILNHILVCEKRFSSIKTANDFVASDLGNTLLDAIVARLQPIAENIKRIIKHNPTFIQKYPEVEWEKIIRFRDFISHHYELLDYEIVFDICEINLPELKKIILKELGE